MNCWQYVQYFDVLSLLIIHEGTSGLVFTVCDPELSLSLESSRPPAATVVGSEV